MAKKNLAAIVINQKNKFYKLNTVSVSNDGSIHIIINNGLSKSDNVFVPFKGTYHTSGFRHFTQGSNEHKQEIFSKRQNSHTQIIESQGLMNYSIKNVDKKQLDCFDEFTNFNKYKNIIKIDAKNYIHLVIQYFLAVKRFNTGRSAYFYDEVFEIDLDSKNKLIIATRNAKSIQDLLDIYL